MSTDIRDVRQRVTSELHQPEPTRQEASVLERLSDPALQKQTAGQATGRESSAQAASGRSGVQWVRASDLLQGHGTKLADLHATGQENVVRRMRHGMSQIATPRRGTARQAATLPPISSFGQTQAAVQGQAVGA
jgi:hypothetical protein